MSLDKAKTENAEKMWKLIDDNRTCMMVTDEEGRGLHGRPMRAIPDPDSGEIWFYTRLSSGKSEELVKEGEVCLTFADPRSSDYVSVTGNAALSRDRERIKKYWSKFVDAWFPEGPEGDDVGMIRVTAKSGEFWDGNSSAVFSAIKMILASEQDKTPDLGESGKVGL